MRIISNSSRLLVLSIVLAGAANEASAQNRLEQDTPLEVTVTYPTPAERSQMQEGPKIEGIILARSGADEGECQA